MTEIVFNVSGMHCQACVQLIESEVGDVAGVESVVVDLEGATATVKFDPTRTDPAELSAAIERAGYGAVAR